MIYLIIALCSIVLMLSNFSFAEEKDEAKLEEIVVTGERMILPKSKISVKSAETLPAQVNVVTSEDIEKINHDPRFSIFSFLRNIPGVVISPTQGNDGVFIRMRGITNVYTALYIDGVPQNFTILGVSHPSLPPYFVTPEMVERIEVIKGPFSPLYGHPTISGAVNIITKKSGKSGLSLETGSYGSFRPNFVISTDKLPVINFISAEYYKTNGYREHSRYTRDANLFAKFTIPIGENYLSFRTNYFRAHWLEPRPVEVNDLIKGIVNRRFAGKNAKEQNDGGENTRYGFVINYEPKGEKGVFFTLYYDKYDFTRYQHHDPNVNRQDISHRNIDAYGGRVFYNLVFDERANATLGIETRIEDGYNRVFPGIRRTITGSATRNLDVKITQGALFAQFQIKVTDFLKVVGGARYDKYKYDIDNYTAPANSGQGDFTIFSPKVGVVITPFKDKNFEIFANAARGFRAPVPTELSPTSSSQKADFGLGPAKLTAYDIGFNILLFERLYLNLAYYQTKLQRELEYDQLQHTYINRGDSKRNGIEGEIRFYVTPKISIWGNFSFLDAKLTNPTTPGQTKVTGIPYNMYNVGLDYEHSFNEKTKFLLDLYYTYWSGSYFYDGTSTNHVRGPVYDIYNARVTLKHKNLTSFLSVAYVPRETASTSVSRSSGTFRIHPLPEWDFRLGVKYEF